MLKLNPQCDVFGDGAFGTKWGLDEVMRVGPSIWDQCPYTKWHHRTYLSLSLSLPPDMWGHSEKVAMHKPGREFIQGTNHQAILISGFPGSRAVRNKHLLLQLHTIYDILLWHPDPTLVLNSMWSWEDAQTLGPQFFICAANRYEEPCL